MAEKYRDKGLVVLAVNTHSNESMEDVKKFGAAQGLKHVLLPGGFGVASKYRVEATPTTFFIDPSGGIVTSHRGFDPALGLAQLELDARAILPR